MKWVLLLILLAVPLSFIPLAQATTINVPATTHFGYGTNCYTNFASTQSLTSTYKSSNYWYFNGYGFNIQNANLTINSFFTPTGPISTKLEYTANASTSTTSTTSIYTATLGTPNSVTGATNWNYNSATSILTISIVHSSPAIIKITWPNTPTAATGAASALQQFLNFLAEGDWLGFLQAIYISAFMSADLFYGFIILLIMAPIYIRTRSLILVCILWILIGSGLIVAAPMVAALGIAFMALGIAGVLLKIFTSLR